MIRIDKRVSSTGISETSLGNIEYSGTFLRQKPFSVAGGHFVPGVGGSALFKTNTYDLTEHPSDDTWNLGVSIAGVYKKGGFLGTVAYAPTWGVAGGKVDYSTMQVVMNYSFKTGTGINMSPLILKNDDFKGDQKWNVPLGLGISQIVKSNIATLNFALSCYYNVVRPDVMKMNNNDWQIQAKFYALFIK